MPITGNASPQRIQAAIEARIRRKLQSILVKLQRIGERCLNEARSAHLYLNQTGNLCSSIGYAITYDGRIVTQGSFINTAGKKGDGSDGIVVGQDILTDIAQGQPPQTLTFVMVAGMPYARYVENRKLNVLKTSEALAVAEIEAMLKQMFTVK